MASRPKLILILKKSWKCWWQELSSRVGDPGTRTITANHNPHFAVTTPCTNGTLVHGTWYIVPYHTIYIPYHIMYQTTPCTAPCTRSHHIIPHRPPCMTLANHNATPYYATLLRGFSSNYNSAVVVLYYVAQSTSECSDDRVTHLHSKNGHTTMWVLQQSLYNTVRVLAASYQSQDNIWRICEEKESQPHRLPSRPLSSPFVTHKFQASVVFLSWHRVLFAPDLPSEIIFA